MVAHGCLTCIKFFQERLRWHWFSHSLFGDGFFMFTLFTLMSCFNNMYTSSVHLDKLPLWPYWYIPLLLAIVDSLPNCTYTIVVWSSRPKIIWLIHILVAMTADYFDNVYVWLKIQVSNIPCLITFSFLVYYCAEMWSKHNDVEMRL